jgi:hypothetical protein
LIATEAAVDQVRHRPEAIDPAVPIEHGQMT